MACNDLERSRRIKVLYPVKSAPAYTDKRPRGLLRWLQISTVLRHDQRIDGVLSGFRMQFKTESFRQQRLVSISIILRGAGRPRAFTRSGSPLRSSAVFASISNLSVSSQAGPPVIRSALYAASMSCRKPAICRRKAHGVRLHVNPQMSIGGLDRRHFEGGRGLTDRSVLCCERDNRDCDGYPHQPVDARSGLNV